MDLTQNGVLAQNGVLPDGVTTAHRYDLTVCAGLAIPVGAMRPLYLFLVVPLFVA